MNGNINNGGSFGRIYDSDLDYKYREDYGDRYDLDDDKDEGFVMSDEEFDRIYGRRAYGKEVVCLINTDGAQF